jgi:acyl-CoA oxidase
LSSRKLLPFGPSAGYLSHKEKYEEAIRKATLVFKKITKLQEQGRDGVEIYM